MREIKFRAWDKRNNKWFHQDLFYISSAAFYPDFRELDDGNSLFDYEYDLMQYTGLKDKNGREIYEGDIVTEKFDDEHDIGSVIFKDGAFWVEFKPEEEMVLGCDSEEIEIIGNIYENPELLAGDKN